MPSADHSPRTENAAHTTLLRALSIENLKSLSGMHEVPLAPLTLIYGQNAAGKSTVLQSIRLLQAWLARLDRPLIEGPEWSQILAEHARLISGHNETLHLGLGFQFGDGTADALRQLSLDVSRSETDPAGVHVAVRRESASATFESADASDQWGKGAYRFLPRESAILHDAGSDELLRRTFHLGPHRGDPSDAYAYRRVEVMPWSLVGRDLDTEALNGWLSHLGVPYRVTPVSIDEADPNHAEYLKTIDVSAAWADDLPAGSDLDRWDLVDTRTHVHVRLEEVGYGVSQLLPIVDYCTRDTSQVIYIEQPELHLHPRLQGNLGDLFVDSVIRGNQIIAETHSENILLRVRRLVREQRLAPDDVALVYVDNDDDGATVRRLRLGDSGELLDPWPTGFFDDTLADILGITE